MILKVCTEIPKELTKTFKPFVHVASDDVEFVHEKSEKVWTNCQYYYSHLNVTQGSCSKHLNVLHMNARSILSDAKFEEFQLFVKGSILQWQVICVSESWVSDEMIPLRQLDGYTGYFKNRKTKIGGGVIIFVNNKYLHNQFI